MERQCRVMNRRPLLPVAAALAAGIALGRFVPLSIPYIIAAVALAAAAFLFRKRALWLCCAALGLLGAFLASNIVAAKTVPVGDELTVTGRVYSDPYINDYGSTVALLDRASIGGEVCGNIKLYTDGETALQCGDVVEAVCEVELPRGVRNPGGFDEKLYLLSEGVYYKAYADTAQATGYRGGPGILFVKARQTLSGVVEAIFEPDVAPIARGMLLGDKSGLDEETYGAFKDTGMAHVLAVSGLHAGILIAFIYYLLRLLRAGRNLRLILTLVFIAVYTCVTGLSPSIVRASIMACALLLGHHFGRQTDALNYLALAFIVSLVFSPLDLFMAGFQLSFGAVLGILTLGAQVKRALDSRLPRKLDKVTAAVSASAGATAGTAPLLAASFNRVSFLSILLNIVVIPVASLAIVLVFIAALAGLIVGSAASYIAILPAAVIRFMMAIIRWAAGIPFIAANIASPPWYLTLAWFAIMLATSGYVLIKTKLKAIFSGALAALAALVLLVSIPSGMYVVFLDVGQGDAAFVRTAQGGEYFIDGGRELSAKEVVSFAVRQGVTPDAAFATHTDGDHFSGLVALYEAGLLHKVYCTYQEEEAVRAAMPDAQVVPLSAGDTVLLDDVTRAVVLYPYRDTVAEDTNDMSLVLLLEYGGHAALFTGDISGAVETRIFAPVGRVDIYKAAHHGSNGSSYRLPLSVLSPGFSVISVGSNRYGHPGALALNNLDDYSEEVLITEEDYAVEFFIDDDIRVHAYGGRD
jgi:competence protein ComEC